MNSLPTPHMTPEETFNGTYSTAGSSTTDVSFDDMLKALEKFKEPIASEVRVHPDGYKIIRSFMKSFFSYENISSPAVNIYSNGFLPIVTYETLQPFEYKILDQYKNVMLSGFLPVPRP